MTEQDIDLIKQMIENAEPEQLAALAEWIAAKGRTSWDTKALDGYAAAHPEIAAQECECAPNSAIACPACRVLLDQREIEY